MIVLLRLRNEDQRVSSRLTKCVLNRAVPLAFRATSRNGFGAACTAVLVKLRFPLISYKAVSRSPKKADKVELPLTLALELLRWQCSSPLQSRHSLSSYCHKMKRVAASLGIAYHEFSLNEDWPRPSLGSVGVKVSEGSDLLHP